MTFTHALSTNNYGPCKFVVATSAANGTHTTLTSALAAASSGDTVFLRDSVTENVTIPAGVNIAAWEGSSLNTPTIIGTVTMTAAGTCAISGIRLQTNSAIVLAVTGSAASIIYLRNCYINATNNTAISFTTSSSSARIFLEQCNGNLGTTGIGYFTNTSAGEMFCYGGIFTNTGGSTTASTLSAGAFRSNYAQFMSPFSTTSTGVLYFLYSNVNTSTQNVTCMTTAGTGVSVVEYSDFISGSASAISVGTGTAVLGLGPIRADSSNTNAITGAGTFNYELVVYTSSSSTNNVVTQSAYPTQPTLGSSSTFVKQTRASTTTAGSTTTAIPYDDSIPQIGEGAEVLTVAITPANSANILVIEYCFHMSCVPSVSILQTFISALFQDATSNALYAQLDFQSLTSTVASTGTNVKGTFYMTAGTTSSTTFRLRVGPAVNTYTYYWLSNIGAAVFSTVNVATLIVSEYTS